jgi:hypothetical protein
MAIDPRRDKRTLEQQLEEATVKIRLIPQIMAIMGDSSQKSKMERELEEAKIEHQRLSALIESRNQEKSQ